MKKKLFKGMTVADFENAYWYADEIKDFAKEIGIKFSTKLRKDELEILIKHYLETGTIITADRKKIKKEGLRDLDKGLSLDLKIINYTSNKITKEFILNEALKIEPDLKKKSGVSYRLNRWREEEIEKGKSITYGDLVQKFLELNRHEGSFEKIPSGRYINFISDYKNGENDWTKDNAIKAWKELKSLDIPKTYADWKKYKDTE